MKRKLMNILFLILCFLVGMFIALASGCSHLGSYQSQHRIGMIADTMQSVVKVIALGYEDNPASGFYIGDGIVVTAGHVARESSLEKVVFENGDECSISQRIRHKDFDVGLLFIAEPNCPTPALVFNTEDLKRGETVYILGHPMDATFIVARGIVSGRIDGPIYGCFGDVSLIITDAIAYRGNSGSVIVDEDGEIRGVYVGTYRVGVGGIFPPGCAVFISTPDILKALEQNKLYSPAI